MQYLSLLALYEQTLLKNAFQPDDKQREVITKLNNIQQQLITRQCYKQKISKNLFNCFSKFINKKCYKYELPVRGLYICGSVGCGKTWIMDLFFQSIPKNRKIRLHFHRLMLKIHQELNQLQGYENPLFIIANRLKFKTDILCVDEFSVSDITDAMLLGILIEALFTCGVSLVMTSNIPPDELYQNGLQRAFFLPAINQIKLHCDIIQFDTNIDYRLRALPLMHIWNYPLNQDTNIKMKHMLYRMSDHICQQSLSLDINHRKMKIRGMDETQGVLAVDFSILCGQGRSQYDYIEISHRFQKVLLHDVLVMTDKNEDQACRFLALIDEFYDRHVKLVVSAENSMHEIYQGKQLKFQYQRCLSRLQEMQSQKYWFLPHLP
ncbi:cell division protein ZapE [Candidatus Pantoea carbekii]|uniref:cell division protein ZapE n=1 Tax=Candidatus Pantoea carbekii TaxID=1235990 RepID=UPI0006187810|nr:cell division protein ZapE [Candidatus Pantoea carbekii]AKC32577.1 ATPase YhcM [Candidatus Pantoea carbekii]